MPFETEYDESLKQLTRVWSGVVTGKEILESHDLATHYLLNGEGVRYIIADYSAVERIETSAEMVRTIALKDKEISAQVPYIYAAVIASNDAVFGLIRMWQTYVEQAGLVVAIFRTRAEGEIWLNQHRK
ncbi:hypothetical protein [Pelotalea chapellei]|uniref:DUF4440 domain-containing protein n=1 Tax=Pelotalea chapellei TaxID=44671 RepID=A0ABS5U3B9_9BACT|nr:hypothetical protein [Pelotalea chapellei]MBT1070166.1 hypothetical protein [Pelotalea chapellei]